MALERLQKFMARCGVASRRACETTIAEGRVRVNGRVVREPGTKIDPATDRVEVDGRILTPPEELVYIALHKPRGYVTTVHDPQGRPTVMDLVQDAGARVYPVGRLDADSEGLLLLTSDGRLAHRLMHPRYGVEKRYRVTVQGTVSDEALQMLAEGVPLEDGMTAPARVRLLARGGRRSVLEITLSEGRKRQVRRMCRHVGHPVVRLVRTAVGPVELGALPPGACRRLTDAEVARLRRAAGLTGQ